MRMLSGKIVAAVCSAAILGLFSIGCDKQPVNVENNFIDSTKTIANDTSVYITQSDTGRYVGSITGRVYSAGNNTPISGMNIVITGDVAGGTGASASVITNSEGYYQFENLRLGAYLLTASGNAAFAGLRGSVAIRVPSAYSQTPGNNNVRLNDSLDFKLLPLTASLNGTVLAQKERVMAKAAANNFSYANIVVEIQTPGAIPSSYIDSTDATGAFSFTKLPAYGSAATMIVHSFTDTNGTIFADSISTILLRSGMNTPRYVTLTSIANPFTVLQSNLDAIAANSFIPADTIRVVMSSNIDGTRLGSVSLMAGAVKVPATISATGATLKVAPQTLLSIGTTYTLSATLFTADGRTSGAITRTFSTLKGIELVKTSYQSTDKIDVRIARQDSIVLTFNKAPVISAGVTEIKLLEGGTTPVRITTTVSVPNMTLTIKASDSLLFNTEYAISIANLKSNLTGDNFNFTDTVKTIMVAAPIANVGAITLESPSFKADYNTTAVPVKWNKTTDAAKYNVYVKNKKHPAWILLSSNKNRGDNISPIQHETISFANAALDMLPFTGGDTIEPFAASSCSLMVIPVNADGIEGSITTGSVFGLVDEVLPSLHASVLAPTNANFNNTSADAKTCTLTVEFTEVLDMQSISTLIISASPATPNIIPTNVNWTWINVRGANATGWSKAEFSITVPGTTDIRTPSRSINISGLRDLSGNPINTTLTPIVIQ